MRPTPITPSSCPPRTRTAARLFAWGLAALGLAGAAHAQTGACCLPTGGCQQVQSTTQCQSMGGTFVNSATCNGCYDLGSCCVNGGCLSANVQHCTYAGGVFSASPCSPTTCPQGGACCDPATGLCFTADSAHCQPPRTFVANAVCSTQPCSPKGACCVNATCVLTSKDECGSMSGTFFSGAGCVPNPCPQVRVCCDAAGACTLVQAASQCNGQLLAGATSCAPNPCPSPRGACCVQTAPGGCLLTNQNNCPAGHSFFAGSTCNPIPCPTNTGACCTSSGACVNVPQAQCGGSIFAPGVPCSPSVCPTPGACCTAAAGCVITSLYNCPNGEWVANSTCDPSPCTGPTGACCAGASCFQAPQAQCTTGVWFPGTTCDANPCKRGGCCNPQTGQCHHVYRPQCDRPGLIFLGPGVACTPTTCAPAVGACCAVTAPVCVQTTKSQCAGAWFAGTGCAPNPCCHADYNGLNGTDLLDIFNFLSEWFRGCP